MYVLIVYYVTSVIYWLFYMEPKNNFIKEKNKLINKAHIVIIIKKYLIVFILIISNFFIHNICVNS